MRGISKLTDVAAESRWLVGTGVTGGLNGSLSLRLNRDRDTDEFLAAVYYALIMPNGSSPLPEL
jgi:hypothetical protein